VLPKQSKGTVQPVPVGLAALLVPTVLRFAAVDVFHPVDADRRWVAKCGPTRVHGCGEVPRFEGGYRQAALGGERFQRWLRHPPGHLNPEAGGEVDRAAADAPDWTVPHGLSLV